MRKSVVIPIIIVVVIVAVVAAVLNWPRDQNGELPSEVPEEILIGCPAAVTGGASGFGEGGVFGYQAAVDDINALGGIYIEEYDTRIPVRLIVRDNESNPLNAADLAEELILTDEVDFLVNVGPLDFNVFVAPKAEQYEVVHMCGPGPLESWLEQREAADTSWEYSWGVSFAIAIPPAEGDFRYGQKGYTMFSVWLGALEEILDETNKKIALLASADPDGTGWYNAFAPEAEGIGCEVYRADEEYGLLPPDTDDFTGVINEWKSADCQLLWSNCPAPFFGTFWAQARSLGYQPKQVFATRSGLFYRDVVAWGGDLPLGICNEMFWHPSIQDTEGIGNTTAMSLHERWVEETDQPLHQNVGWCYAVAQTLFDAIERAGTLDSAQVNAALAETDLMTVYHRVVFDENHWSRIPVAFGQWHKTEEEWVWQNEIVYSPHDFLPATGEFTFPIPYE
jgi:branched-chain amino acid transport system substrate-binding protein